MIKVTEIMESLARGFVEGMGLDSALWILTAYIPQLGEQSPIRIPTWHHPEENTHWDDLIGIAISAGIAIYGAVKRKPKIIVEGASMILGEYILSKHQARAYPLTTTTATAPTGFSDLVKVD